MSVRKPGALLHDALHLQLVGSIDHGYIHRVLDPGGHSKSLDIDRVVRTLLRNDVLEAWKGLLDFASKFRLGTNPAGPIHEERMHGTEEESNSKLTHVGLRASTIYTQGSLDQGKHLGMDMIIVRVDRNQVAFAKCMHGFG